MSGRQTDISVVAQHQVQLMWPVTYDGSVLGRTRDPLEWIPLGLPSPMSGPATSNVALGVVGLVQGRVLLGQTLPTSSS
jgi:hypothetical protein